MNRATLRTEPRGVPVGHESTSLRKTWKRWGAITSTHFFSVGWYAWNSIDGSV